MSTPIAAKELGPRDLFATATGSVYQATGRQDAQTPVQARLWCAHAPDPLAFAPPLVDLLPDESVQLLSKEETRPHLSHPGFVRTAFEHEMDRHHQEHMAVYATNGRAAAEAAQRQQVQRPWWKKLFS